MTRKLLFALKILSIGYFMFIGLSLIVSMMMHIPSVKEVGHLQNGCYWTNGVVGYIVMPRSVVEWVGQVLSQLLDDNPVYDHVRNGY